MSRGDLEPGDFVVFEREVVPQVHWAAGEVSDEPSGHSQFSPLDLDSNRLACIATDSVCDEGRALEAASRFDSPSRGPGLDGASDG